jgi:anti-sigma regulatory factor (Ser/Thr protein kinase)
MEQGKPQMTEELSFELAGGPYAVTAARLALADTEWRLDASTAFDMRLLVSELVTNSVQHAGVGPQDSITMRVRLLADGVRVEIGDGGEGFERPPSPEPSRNAGWGLFLVDQLSSSWGVESGEEPFVWFELRRGEREDPGVAA